MLTTDTVGGVWTFTKTLADELLQLGHAVALISFGKAPSQAQLQWCAQLDALHNNRFMYVPSSVPLEWMAANAFAYSDALPELLNLAESFRPDLVHTSQFSYGYLPLSIPIVVTAHSDVMTWAVACQPEGLEPSAWLSQYRFLVERGLCATSVLVAPTEWMLIELRKHFNFTADSQVILNGRTLPSSTEELSRHSRAVSAGRLWDRGKNVHLLTKVQAETPIFVAGTEDPLDASRSTDFSELQLLGNLDELELLDFLRSSSVYIVPSLYEPFGLAALEAALCGCAVLANDIPSLREVWGGSVRYFRSAEELTRLLKDLCESEGLLLRAQQDAFTHACQLSARKMTLAYILVYERLVAKAKAGTIQHDC